MTRRVQSTFGAAVLALTWVLIASASMARAQAPAPAAPRRSWGLGTALGGGYGVASVRVGSSSKTGSGPLLVLPTVEARFFFGSGYSIDVMIPLTNTIIVGAADSYFAWATDAFFNINYGSGGVRLLAGPGLGFSIASGGGTTFAGIRVPAVLGVEVLTAGRGFGFQVMARPYIAFSFGDSSVTAVSGGILGMLGVVFYGTR